MLRDFQTNPQSSLIAEILQQFGFDIKEEKFPFLLLKFEVLSPDSFIWRLLIKQNVYYLYSEDYVPSLEHIKQVFDDQVKGGQWTYVKPLKTTCFESSGPVKAAEIYRKPDEASKIMNHAVDSGYDYVFLVKSNEDADDAQFSDSVADKTKPVPE